MALPRDGPSHGRTLAVVAGLAMTVACLIGLAFAPGVYQVWRAGDYPGAPKLSDHTLYNLSGLTIRRDTSYRTRDEFPVVYNWYSAGHNLGPESQAHSNCILMEHGRRDLWVVNRHMAVMLCDTTTGRLIFVMRTVSLRLP